MCLRTWIIFLMQRTLLLGSFFLVLVKIMNLNCWELKLQHSVTLKINEVCLQLLRGIFHREREQGAEKFDSASWFWKSENWSWNLCLRSAVLTTTYFFKSSLLMIPAALSSDLKVGKCVTWHWDRHVSLWQLHFKCMQIVVKYRP